ncbi:Hsp20/alpha crystallin family protein [Bacillus sp. B15-48]|uniref:Hsp20/alpha crystallin family protein n=1 Tax=Bacillus sp. B15-48 TaxID=1548601 RepID=UPI00193F1157|nr:Hsp20/alpha crystallin family protein [Bacillus sp. B15-48]MBM4765222.1 Hsp20 family protein [Bacillus sp. B15-48]
MNKYWPKNWKNKLPMPNFLGEDFFSTFEQFENMEVETESEPNQQISKHSRTAGIKVNIYESGHELLCIFRLPGLKLKEVDIDVYDKFLEVKGTVHIHDNGFRPIQQEIFQGSVFRKVELPYPVRTDKIDASYHHGYLLITLHRLIRSDLGKPKIVIHDHDKA